MMIFVTYQRYILRDYVWSTLIHEMISAQFPCSRCCNTACDASAGIDGYSKLKPETPEPVSTALLMAYGL
jgi:hypothetical protein